MRLVTNLIGEALTFLFFLETAGLAGELLGGGGTAGTAEAAIPLSISDESKDRLLPACVSLAGLFCLTKTKRLQKIGKLTRVSGINGIGSLAVTLEHLGTYHTSVGDTAGSLRTNEKGSMEAPNWGAPQDQSDCLLH